MKYRIFAAVLAVTLLAGCSDRREPSQTAPKTVPPAASTQVQDPGREQQTTLAGQLPAILYTGDGYSIYIPDEGWTLELECDEDVVHQTWESDREDDAALSVYHYENVSFMVARDRFLKESDFSFSADSGGALVDPLLGKDNDGDICKVMVAEGSHGVTYVIAWEYPADAEETCGVTLGAMADSFALTE